MKKSVQERLKIEKPEYYDATDSRVAVIQDHKLRTMLHSSFRDGRKIGSVSAFFVFALSTTITLVSVEEFKEKFFLSAPTWEAIFVLAMIGGWIAFMISIVKTAISWHRTGYFGEPKIDHIFSNDNIIPATAATSGKRKNRKNDVEERIPASKILERFEEVKRR